MIAQPSIHGATVHFWGVLNEAKFYSPTLDHVHGFTEDGESWPGTAPDTALCSSSHRIVKATVIDVQVVPWDGTSHRMGTPTVVFVLEVQAMGATYPLLLKRPEVLEGNPIVIVPARGCGLIQHTARRVTRGDVSGRAALLARMERLEAREETQGARLTRLESMAGKLPEEPVAQEAARRAGK